MISAAITEVSGASDVFDCGFVTYSNQAKVRMLGVNVATLAAHGAVSEQVAHEMAEGALRSSHAHIAVAVTGIAGPGGATPGKPVGLVYIAVANAKTGQSDVKKNIFTGDRSAVRLSTVETALNILKEQLDQVA